MHVVDALLHLVIQTVDMQLLAQPGFDDPAVVGNLSGIGFGGAGLPQQSRQALDGGWFRSGDIGMLDAEGFLTIVDRIKDVINRAGEKIAAAEVESCLLQHPDLAEAAVIALPDADTGEAVVAIVVARDGCAPTVSALQAFAAARLASYKRPQRIHIRSSSLPRNPVGKLLKQQLRGEYERDGSG